MASVKAFESFKTRIKDYHDHYLGISNCNLAAIEGGIFDRDEEGIVKYDKKGKPILLWRANKVPDIARVLIEVRTSRSDLDASKSVELYNEEISKLGCIFRLSKIEYDFKPFSNNRNALIKIEVAVRMAGLKIIHKDSSKIGYYDSQLFNKKFGIPCVSFGPAKDETSHRIDEHTTIGSLEKTADVYEKIIKLYR